MARVNHKLVKQRLNEKRSSITDRQFFSSRILAGHFEDIATAQTKRYKYNRRVRVNLYWNSKDGSIACTNNEFIRINCGNKFVTKTKGRENRYNIVAGLFAHELGHVLYTDFLGEQTHTNAFAGHYWYPATPILKSSSDKMNERAIWDYIAADEKNLEMVQFIVRHIQNIIEDGYIENRMLANFPGTLKYGLECVRKKHFESMDTVTQMIEYEDNGDAHICESILQIILSYAKFGEIKYGDEPLTDERIKIVFSLLSDIDRALLGTSSKERFDVTNTILIRCWDYIHSYLEYCKEKQAEAEAAGGTATIAETLGEMLKAISASSEIAEGETSPVQSAGNESNASATGKNRAKTRLKLQEAEKSDDENSDDGSGEGENSDGEENSDENDSSQTETENSENESQSGEDNSTGEISDGDADSGNGMYDGHKQDVTSSEKGRLPHEQTDCVSDPIGGSVEKNDEYEPEIYSNAASDIEQVLEKMAERAACKELESKRTQELNEAAQNISYGNVHSGVHVRVNRINEVDEKLIEYYNQVAEPLLKISKQLKGSLVRQLKENRRGGKQTGLIMGRRLDAHSLHRNDGKVFYKNALPNEIPEISISVLLDESGSMSSCQRSTYARAAAIILHDFCESLNIPIMVYGHSTGYAENYTEVVELFSYAEFEGFDNNDKYRLMDISSRGNNRDGAALRFVAEQLSKRPEEIKILFLVSDGQPAASGYYGTAAEEDLRGIKHEYGRKGVLLIAAAIGDDKESIERIYGDSFMDITDLEQLPAKLTSVIKRHIRV